MDEQTEASANPCATVGFSVPSNLWSDTKAASLDPAGLLLYRSNLLGSDLTVTNFGGGNTSAKLTEMDPLTAQAVEILWVKGSGGDIGSMDLGGFATLYLDKLLALENLYCGIDAEDKMVDYLPHCTFGLNPRAASIDTPLHAYLPFKHVDHVHPDAIIALAASSGGEEITNKLWHGRIGWLAWQRPGFDLGLKLRNLVASNPQLDGVMLAGHGIICWADTAKRCYEHTINLIADAAQYLNARQATTHAFGGQKMDARSSENRFRAAASLMPTLRGLMRSTLNKVGHFSDDYETMEFVNSNDFNRLAAIGTSCPDHFLRTKIAPLTLDPAEIDDRSYLATEIAAYRDRYVAYYKRCAKPTSPPMRDANPVVILIPSVGRITFAADKTTARLASEFYGNAINVMRGAELIGAYIGLDEQEAFDIEYWALEEAKLQRMPKRRQLAGKIALVTGAAGGIGSACVELLLQEGASVMLLDRDEAALTKTAAKLAALFRKDDVRFAVCDVTDEAQIENAFTMCAREFGGLDIIVANAGIASSAPIEETTVDLWRKNFDVLAEGYFLTARAAFKMMKAGGGGSIVFIGSKNGLAAAAGASAYASAKAAALHLARCLALEGGPSGIRVNTVNPDAVIKGSSIWDGDWRKERAEAHGIDVGLELEEHYRNRSLLKLDVLPTDVAEAVLFLASDASAKSTGNIINVDSGNAQAFTR